MKVTRVYLVKPIQSSTGLLDSFRSSSEKPPVHHVLQGVFKAYEISERGIHLQLDKGFVFLPWSNVSYCDEVPDVVEETDAAAMTAENLATLDAPAKRLPGRPRKETTV